MTKKPTSRFYGPGMITQCWFLASSFKLQATSCKRISFKLQASSFKLQASSFKLQASSFKRKASARASSLPLEACSL
jgi:hypothetical protein